MSLPPRCPKCSNQWLYEDMDGPACPVCGWRPTRTPTKLERSRAHPSMHIPREPKAPKPTVHEDDPWDALASAMSAEGTSPKRPAKRD